MRLVLDKRDVEKLRDQTNGRLGYGNAGVVMCKGVLDVLRFAILGIVAVWGEDGVVVVEVGGAVEWEAEVDVGGEEGRVAEVVNGVGAEEDLEVIALLFGVGGELVWDQRRQRMGDWVRALGERKG